MLLVVGNNELILKTVHFSTTNNIRIYKKIWLPVPRHKFHIQVAASSERHACGSEKFLNDFPYHEME